MKRVIFDEKKDYMGCKSLNLEGRMYVKDGQLMLDGEKVLAYHHAKGKDFPKLRFQTMGFTQEVVDHLIKVAFEGNSILIK